MNAEVNQIRDIMGIQAKHAQEQMNRLETLVLSVERRLDASSKKIENAVKDLHGLGLVLGSDQTFESQIPEGYRLEDGFSEAVTFFGGRLHWRIEEALNQLNNSSDPLDRQVAQDAKPYTIVTFQNFPELKPDDPVIASRAAQALSNNFSRAAIGIARSVAYGVDHNPADVPVQEDLEYHVTLWVAPDYDLDLWAAQTADALLSGSSRIRERIQQEAEDEANGVIKPTPGPGPRP